MSKKGKKGEKIVYLGSGEKAGGFRALMGEDSDVVEFAPTGADETGEAYVVGVNQDDPFPVMRCHKVQLPKGSGSGPAQTASPAYQKGWDRIFGKKKKKRTLLN